MINVMFVCHGNICRSPMAEFILRDRVQKRGAEHLFRIASSATSSEEIGNPVHPGTRRVLARCGISAEGKRAVQLTKQDYMRYDYILAMDNQKIRDMMRIIGDYKERNVHLLLDFSSRSGQISDPWYSGDFEATYRDISEGCDGFLEKVLTRDY